MEKLRINLRYLGRYFIYHSLFWYSALLLYVFLTGENQLFRNYFSAVKVDSIFINIFYVAEFLALLFTFLDAFFTDRILRFSPVKLMALLRFGLYFIIVVMLYILALNPIQTIQSTNINLAGIKNLLPEFNLNFIRFITYFYIACFLNNFFKDMVKRIGKGVYLKWLWGLLRKPREEERIFMFIDMTSSTTIAEKLGHKKFSYLVQDIFNDMAIVDNYNADIYNYLGDGAIITWNVKQGIQNNNCLKAFFAFEQVIEKRKKAYERKYGLKPAFKAGLHVGDIMVLQIGSIRRDISYNGDTLNTTARIESMCNEYKSKLLISGDLYNLLKDKKEFTLKNMGDTQLKGKKSSVDIYSVKAKKAPARKSFFEPNKPKVKPKTQAKPKV